MTKSELERLIRAEDIHPWQIAKAISIHESTLSRWFRSDELTETVIAQRIQSLLVYAFGICW